MKAKHKLTLKEAGEKGKLKEFADQQKHERGNEAGFKRTLKRMEKKLR